MKKKFVRLTYEFFNRNIIITTIVGGSSAIWFTFVKIFEIDFNLKDDTGNYVSWVAVLNYIFISISLLFIIFKSIGDKYNVMVSKNGTRMIYKLITSINSYKSFKSNKFIRATNHMSPNFDNYCLSFQPEENISELLSIMSKYLSEIFGLKKYEIGLSVLYNYKNADKIEDWKLIATESVKNDLTKNELITNPYSTVYEIIQGKEEYIFYASKNDALKRSQYVKSRKDSDMVKGSILCYGFGTDRIIAALSLTTYSKQICEVGDTESELKLKELAIETLANRLLVEILIDAMNDKKYCHVKNVKCRLN